MLTLLLIDWLPMLEVRCKSNLLYNNNDHCSVQTILFYRHCVKSINNEYEQYKTLTHMHHTHIYKHTHTQTHTHILIYKIFIFKFFNNGLMVVPTWKLFFIRKPSDSLMGIDLRLTAHQLHAYTTVLSPPPPSLPPSLSLSLSLPLSFSHTHTQKHSHTHTHQKNLQIHKHPSKLCINIINISTFLCLTLTLKTKNSAFLFKWRLSNFHTWF